MTPLNNHFYVAIMAGGIGSRFWPYSRTDYPKSVPGYPESGKTSCSGPMSGLRSSFLAENIYVVTHHQYASTVSKQLPNLPQENIVSETVPEKIQLPA